MTHHNHVVGKTILDKLEPAAAEAKSDVLSDVLMVSIAISLKRIADYIDEIEYSSEVVEEAC